MARFKADSITLCYANSEAAKEWWIHVFECKPVAVPKDWDDTDPSDIALQMPGDDSPVVLLIDPAKRGLDPSEEFVRTVPIIFCGNLKKAQSYLMDRGAAPGPVQDGGDTQFFEIRDPEGHVIEICGEP